MNQNINLFIKEYFAILANCEEIIFSVFEKKNLIKEKNHGNISKAAVQLGLTRTSLYRRIEKYGL